jgi:hypothetical protein
MPSDDLAIRRKALEDLKFSRPSLCLMMGEQLAVTPVGLSSPVTFHLVWSRGLG